MRVKWAAWFHASQPLHIFTQNKIYFTLWFIFIKGLSVLYGLHYHNERYFTLAAPRIIACFSNKVFYVHLHRHIKFWPKCHHFRFTFLLLYLNTCYASRSPQPRAAGITVLHMHLSCTFRHSISLHLMPIYGHYTLWFRRRHYYKCLECETWGVFAWCLLKKKQFTIWFLS